MFLRNFVCVFFAFFFSSTKLLYFHSSSAFDLDCALFLPSIHLFFFCCRWRSLCRSLNANLVKFISIKWREKRFNSQIIFFFSWFFQIKSKLSPGMSLKEWSQIEHSDYLFKQVNSLVSIRFHSDLPLMPNFTCSHHIIV